MGLYLQALLGLAVFYGLAWALGVRKPGLTQGRRARLVAVSLGLQVILALAFIKIPLLTAALTALNGLVTALSDATAAGTAFVFGYIGGGSLPYTPEGPGSTFILAFQALPLILVISALSSLFYYWRILPVIVDGLAWCLRRSMGLGGAASLSVAANIFIGMVEAPLLVRPYLARMSRGELFLVMVGGMATISGTVMILYAQFLKDVIEGALGHILLASLISAPAAIGMARLMEPDEGETQGDLVTLDHPHGAMDAITQGTLAGVKLLISVVAMLIVFVALVSLINALLAMVFGQVTLEGLLGTALAPVAWLLGVTWEEAIPIGALIGTKTVLNELIAYLSLSGLEAEVLSPRSRLIAVYALCGFANFGSLGIMIGGLATMAPARAGEISRLGPKSILAGTLATLCTGAVVGLLV